MSISNQQSAISNQQSAISNSKSIQSRGIKMPSRLSSKTKSFNSIKFKQKNSKSAQAAMEFLMTYGWALLVVLIAIAALAYFGLLNPSRFLPDKVNLGPGLTVAGAQIDDVNVVLLVKNDLGETIRDFQANVTNCQNGLISEPVNIIPGKTQRVTVYCPDLIENTKFTSDVIVNYITKNLGHELSHKKTGDIAWTVGEPVDIESFNGAGQSYSSSRPLVINTTYGHMWQAGDSGTTLAWGLGGTPTDGETCDNRGAQTSYPACEYCENLAFCYNGSFDETGECEGDYGGVLFSDWRLPSGDVAYTAGLDYSSYQSGIQGSSYFTDGTGFDAYDYYWTGTSYSSTYAYFVVLDLGYMDNGYKADDDSFRARCVRDQ